MEETDTIIYMKKKNKDQKNIKKITVRLKRLNLIINIFYGFKSVWHDLVIDYQTRSIYVIRQANANKSLIMHD